VGEDHARLALGVAQLVRGDVEAGRSQIEAARALYEIEGNESWMAKTDGSLGGLAIWAGDFETARPLLASSMEQTQRLEGDVSFMIPYIVGASLAAYEANADACRRIVADGLSLLEVLPPGAIRSASVSAMLATRATVAALEGDRVAARAEVDAAAAELSPQAWVSIVAGAYAHLAAVAVWLDEIVEAESYVHAALERIRTDEAWLFAVDLLTAAAGLRARVGAAEDAVRFLAAADASGQRMGVRAVRHPMWDARAEVERLRGVLGDGPFDELWTSGARLSLTDAVDLALKGRGPRQRPSSGWDSLTPMELKVVGLVAEGLTNPQIAEQLFISKRTVSTHLSHVFAKLGVASRAELASLATERRVGS
jgi:DNA-binding CsgD family transcriptional regulator